MALSKLRIAFEPVLRRAFHFYWRFSRGLTLGVRGMVIDGAGRIFLIQHGYVSGWHLPGGGVEPRETALEALARELKEEGNIDLVSAPAFHGLFHNSRVSGRDHIAVYVVRSFRQDSAPVPDREIVAHGFFAPDELPSETTRSTRARIAEVLSGLPAPQRW
jgi:8-oxo-dGTP pyrophosphatase MutT (NUDIX family)